MEIFNICLPFNVYKLILCASFAVWAYRKLLTFLTCDFNWDGSFVVLAEEIVIRRFQKVQAQSSKIFNFKGCDVSLTQYQLPHLEAIISLMQYNPHLRSMWKSSASLCKAKN